MTLLKEGNKTYIDVGIRFPPDANQLTGIRPDFYLFNLGRLAMAGFITKTEYDMIMKETDFIGTINTSKGSFEKTQIISDANNYGLFVEMYGRDIGFPQMTISVRMELPKQGVAFRQEGEPHKYIQLLASAIKYSEIKKR
jgi:hypothetical protein